MKQCTCYALRAIDCTCKPAKYGELYTSPTPKQEQGEPVACVETKEVHGQMCSFIYRTDSTKLLPDGAKLYTTPQQRTWVGLQDWEIKKLVGNDRYTDLLTAVAIAVEKELKARNT